MIPIRYRRLSDKMLRVAWPLLYLRTVLQYILYYMYIFAKNSFLRLALVNQISETRCLQKICLQHMSEI